VAAQNTGGWSPVELLRGVSWTVRGEPFADQSAFKAAVAAYRDDTRGEVRRPEEVVLHAARICVGPDVC
jgi:hypothetical protein